MGSIDPQIALLLLPHCASFCKFVHLACSTPPPLISDGLALFDADVHRHFSDCVAIDASDLVWQHAQLSLSRGGLGLRKLALHCSAAFLASVNKAGCTTPPDEFTAHTVAIFNSLVPPLHTPSQWNLCRLQPFVKKIYPPGLKTTNLTSCSSLLPLPTVLACSRSHPGCQSSQFQVALKWWLGVDMSPHLRCPHCPDHQLDPLGYHALTCQGGWDAVLRHNSLRDVVAQFCQGLAWVVNSRWEEGLRLMVPEAGQPTTYCPIGPQGNQHHSDLSA